MSRRRFLAIGAGGAVAVGAAGLGLAEAGVIPGKGPIDRVLNGGCGPRGTVPDAAAPAVIAGTFTSEARRGIAVRYRVVMPPAAGSSGAPEPMDGLPVCIALHGRGSDATWIDHGLHLDRFLADAVTTRHAAPFAVVGVDGGSAVNWHRRADGDDPLRMITEELLPLLSGRGLRTDRVAVWGWSLGGHGALRLAAEMGAGRTAAAVASSPALWTSYEDAQPGTYDSAADFAANSMIGRGSELAGIPLRIDCGRADPFADAVDDFRHSIHPSPAGGLRVGCHDASFWTGQAAAELAFVATHLAGPTR